MLDFNPVKIGNSFTELLSFQLQVLYSSVMFSVKIALLRKKLLKESVTVTERII